MDEPFPSVTSSGRTMYVPRRVELHPYLCSNAPTRQVRCVYFCRHLYLTPCTGPGYPSMPGYQTKQENIAIAGVQDLIIRSLLDKQQFSDPLGEAERLGISSAAWPLFGQLWPSGALLAARLALRNVNARERILEIGCGLALASLVGHRRGADVTASDCHPLAERFLNENLRLNALLPLKYRHGHWGIPTPASHHEDGSIRLNVEGVYQLIIGSDVLYERDANAGLAQFIALHSAPGGEVWIVDPDRSNRSAFNRQMSDGGFVVHEEVLSRIALSDLPVPKARLLIYRRAM